MSLFKSALVGLGLIVVGLGIEGYFVGMTAVFLTVMAPIVLVAFVTVAFEWWEPVYSPGVVLDLPGGPHAVVGVSGFRRKLRVVPVKHKAGMTYERAGEVFLLSESEILNRATGARDFCVIDCWNIPNGT